LAITNNLEITAVEVVGLYNTSLKFSWSQRAQSTNKEHEEKRCVRRGSSCFSCPHFKLRQDH